MRIDNETRRNIEVQMAASGVRTVAELARRSGIAYAALWKAMHGSRHVQDDELARITRALDPRKTA